MVTGVLLFSAGISKDPLPDLRCAVSAQNFLRGLFLGRLPLGRLADEKIGRISRSCCSLSCGASATTRRMCSWRCSGVMSDLPAAAALRTGLLALAPVLVVAVYVAASTNIGSCPFAYLSVTAPSPRARRGTKARVCGS